MLVGIAVTKRTTPSFPRIQANVTSMTLPFAPAIEITWLYFMPYWVTPVSFEPLRLRSPSYVVGIEQVPFKLVQIAFLRKLGRLHHIDAGTTTCRLLGCEDSCVRGEEWQLKIHSQRPSR
ncbi:hypothetical protein [Mycobacterium avium]|uniref:hypothetical protein n=1 Tax=Mycobacterium avium TaxID=1764 RepID=UPI00115567A7|nr:hypothetical protein [Mycobacterium avium]